MGNLEPSSLAVDVLIVGSGPIGATFARMICERLPQARVLMTELGPQLTARPGQHVKNIASADERTKAQIRSQGPAAYQYTLPSMASRAAGTTLSGPARMSALARPGTFLVDAEDPGPGANGMPAAALSSNVGGMGAHWTCACPSPGNAERIAFIADDEWNDVLGRAQALLHVTTQAYLPSLEGLAIQHALGEVFNAGRPEDRKVQPMPLACTVVQGKRYWTGVDSILGPLVEVAQKQEACFTLRSETICRRILTDGERATGAIIEHLPSGKRETVAARVVVVAADALRTPQLLWASGIRPPALGHYLNDQPQIGSGVVLDRQLIERTRAALRSMEGLVVPQRTEDEQTVGVFWVPFHAPDHPYHGQVMHLDLAPIPLHPTETQAGRGQVVGLGWFCRKEVRYEDYVSFSETETDYLGMPKMSIHYELTPTDKEEIARAMQAQKRAAAALGTLSSGNEPYMVPPGSSLHYQGTLRMGERDDGVSVCDSTSRVWGFQNLFVGGNGVIPTATACNPTLTSVALAIRASDTIVSLLAQ